MKEKELINACRKGDRKAQEVLYKRFAPKMFGVCKRYLRKYEDAEDVCIEGIAKVFQKLDMYKGKGSFEGWVRRIMVNEALMFLRKKNNFNMTVEISNIEIKSQVSVVDELAAEDILNLLNKLPVGYRTVFNLYALEGYKHREIAELLGISINTSKSQYRLACKRLRSMVKGIGYERLSG